MTCFWRWIGWLTLPISLLACQSLDPNVGSKPAEPKLVSAPVSVDNPRPRVNWSEAGDCRSMVSLLKQGLDQGRILDFDETPFLLIDDQTAGHGGLRSVASRRAGTGAGISSAAIEARCVLRVGSPGKYQSEHRVLGREQVRSRYQSGTRAEKNPAYEVAKVRLRRAEKAAKPGKSSIAKVGDPLIDLVGTLVGGALTGFGQWGAGDQLEEALDTLMATPPSIDHPVYKSYHFERARVRASREAVLPVILTDRQLQRSWQISLKRRELRDLSVVNGLDRQDVDYAHHSQNSLTESSLQQWLVEAPSPSLADIVAGLLDRPSTVPLDRLALAGERASPVDTDPFAGDQELDAAALPASRTFVPRRDLIERMPSEGGVSGSQIKVVGEAAQAEGVFIAPNFILTPSEVVGDRGLVDIEDGPGHLALGLVAAVDHGLGLALIQAPLAGQPVTLAPAGSGKERPTGRVFNNDLDPTTASRLPDGSIGAPILIGEKLAGFRTKAGPNIESDAIALFLNRQQHLLLVDR